MKRFHAPVVAGHSGPIIWCNLLPWVVVALKMIYENVAWFVALQNHLKELEPQLFMLGFRIREGNNRNMIMRESWDGLDVQKFNISSSTR